MTITGRIISKKRNYRRSKNGGMYLSQEWKNFEDAAVLELRRQHKGDPIDKYLKVTYQFYIHGKRRIDIDNAVVSVNDLLQTAGVITDDHNIMEMHVKKIPGCGGWSTKIEIEEI